MDTLRDEQSVREYLRKNNESSHECLARLLETLTTLQCKYAKAAAANAAMLPCGSLDNDRHRELLEDCSVLDELLTIVLLALAGPKHSDALVPAILEIERRAKIHNFCIDARQGLVPAQENQGTLQ